MSYVQLQLTQPKRNKQAADAHQTHFTPLYYLVLDEQPINRIFYGIKFDDDYDDYDIISVIHDYTVLACIESSCCEPTVPIDDQCNFVWLIPYP